VKAASPVLNGGDGETAHTALCPYPTTDAAGHVLAVVILERHDGVPQTAGSPRAADTAEPMRIPPARGEAMSVIFPPTAEPMPIVPPSDERMPMTVPPTPLPMPIEPARESMGMPLAR
jgi:hypothetical protein